MDVYGNDIPNISIEVQLSVGMSLNKKRKLSLICENPARSEVVVCGECYNTLLAREEGMPKNHYCWVDCWPVFMWKMFSDPCNIVQALEMWKYLPHTMHCSWLQSYKAISPNHNAVSLFEPQSYFDDITNFVEEVEKLSGSGQLVDLMKSCNKNCYCNVRCPWGCTEFPDECGYVGHDKFLFAFLKGVEKPISESSIQQQLKNAR